MKSRHSRLGAPHSAGELSEAWKQRGRKLALHGAERSPSSPSTPNNNNNNNNNHNNINNTEGADNEAKGFAEATMRSVSS